MNENFHNEHQLLQQVASGDTQAFAALVDRYGALVFYYIRKHTRSRELTEEIVQDIFTQVWLLRDSLGEIRHFKAFLHIVSRNYALNILKKLTREQQKQAAWKEEVSADNVAMPHEDEDWRIGLVRKAVDQLPPQQQKVWILGRREGLSHSEIASQMNISKASVKKYMQLANAFVIKYIKTRISILLAAISSGAM